MDYTYLKYKDVHTIKNNSVVETLTYKLYIRSCEGATTLVTEGEILPTETATITFRIDGVYVIILNDGVIDETLPDILHYENTLKKLIQGTQKVLCGCKPCTDCEENCDSCEDILDTITLDYLYESYMSPRYDSLITEVKDSLKFSSILNKGASRTLKI